MLLGIGLRKEIGDKLLSLNLPHLDFLEVTPENWMGVGGARKQLLKRATERYPLTTHGLSLSLGSRGSLWICSS